MDFAETYGPWAIIAGASEGVGSAFATAVAERGVNVVLLSRRQRVLDDLAAQITSATGAEARTLAVDLAEPTATDQIVTATSDLDLGLLMYCAGADPKYQHFLDGPVDDALSHSCSATASCRCGCAITSHRRWWRGDEAGSSS